MRVIAGITVASLLWLGAHALRNEAIAARASWPKTDTMLLVPPVEVAPFVPYRELMADLLWCRLLVYYGSNWGGEGDLSQVEQLLDNIIALDPRFKAVYEWGAFAVAYRHGTATQEEFHSSLRYLDRAMKEYPDDYRYFWLAGVRYYFDLWSKDPTVVRHYRERGAELIEAAMTKPNAPPSLAEDAASMRTKLGQFNRALDNLREMIATTSDERVRARMLKRVRLTDPDLADELANANARLLGRWLENMASVPLDFYILLGDPPSRVIDLRALTTPRDLFGTATGDEAE